MNYNPNIKIQSVCAISIACMSSNITLHSENKRPNIIVAIADDAAWKHFSAYGCKWVKTPAFDYVAQNGVLFNNA